MTVKELLCKAEEVAKKNRWTRGTYMRTIFYKNGQTENAYCAIGYLRQAYWDLEGQPLRTVDRPYVNFAYREAMLLLATAGFGREVPDWTSDTSHIITSINDTELKRKGQLVTAFKKACAAAPDA